MKAIKNIETVTDIYSEWKPSDIAFVKTIEWSINSLVLKCYCQLRTMVNKWPDTSKDFFEITLTFKNASNFRLNFSGAGLQQISGFDILDVSANGMEKTNFQIEDYENDCITFNCEDIEINELLKPIKIFY